MKRILSILLLTIIFSGCASGPKEVKFTEEQQIEHDKALRFLDNLKGENVYIGEGWGELGEDRTLSLEKAKNSSIQDLISKIEVEVSSEIETILTGSSINKDGVEKQRDSSFYRRKSKQFAMEVLTNLKGGDIFYHYPLPNSITYVTYIDKDEFDERVKDQIEISKKSICDLIRKGNSGYEGANYISALSNWAKAKKVLSDNFGNIPVEGDIDMDGIDEPLNSYIDSSASGIIENIYLEVEAYNLTYNAKGNLNGIPVVRAHYRDNYNQTMPVSGLPLNISFTEGGGDIVGNNLVTGREGSASIQFRKVDPSNPNTSVTLSIDEKRLPGYDLFGNTNRPEVSFDMSKMRSIALSVNFRNNGSNTTPSDITDRIGSRVLDNNFAMSNINISKREPNFEDINRANKTNADYLIHIYLDSGIPSTVGGYSNMFVGRCSGKVSLFRLPSGSIISSERLKTTEGAGSTASDAGWDSYSKLRSDIESKVESVMGKIQ